MKFLPNLFITIILLTCTICQEDYEFEAVYVKLQLADFDISDAYDEVSDVTKETIVKNLSYKEKISVEQNRGNLLRTQAKRNMELGTDLPYDLLRNWTLLTKPGDSLLPEEHYNSLVEFHNINQELSSKGEIACIELNSKNCKLHRQGVTNVLNTNRNLENLKKVWTNWQNVYQSNEDKYLPILQVANEAFRPNEEHSVESYWEMLSEYDSGYSKAKILWEEVQPLYRKLYDFVKVRLVNCYKINGNDSSIPIYLLGSNFGTEWDRIADIILPHPYFFDEVETELKYHTVKSIFKLAEDMTKTMTIGPLGRKFWTKSNFHFSSCEHNIFSHCHLKSTEILTCQKLKWNEFLNIHETAINVALRNVDYNSLARRDLRYSALDEALQNLGSVLAINNLPFNNFIPKDAFKNEEDTYNYKNTALLLVALRFLPKLPYYLLADTWRLDELSFSYGNTTENWWEKRKEMQGVESVTNLEHDFLGDSYITSNKPYLSKFLGIFLQFELLDYFQKYHFTEGLPFMNLIGNDDNFKTFIKDRPNFKWPELLNFHYGLSDISSAALLDYFRPLEEYLDNAPLNQVKISTTEKPRTTKSPTKKPTKAPIINKNNTELDMLSSNETQNDQNFKPDESQVSLNTTNVKSSTNKSSFEKMYVFFGVIGGILGIIAVVMIVRRLKRKPRPKPANRRFEA